MKRFVLAALALLGVTTVASPPARADVVVRDHRAEPGVRVRVAPPVVRTEVRVAAPSGRHVWVPGYWGWQGGRHVWYGGRWQLPPVEGQVWVEPRWANEGGEWVFYNGYWSEPRPGTIVVGPAPQPAPPPGPPPGPPPPPQVVEQEWDVEGPPPPVRAEDRPPPPGPRFVWVNGYWGWTGREHAWVPGHWEAGRPGFFWAQGRWVRHGHHWRWHPGHWVRR